MHAKPYINSNPIEYICLSKKIEKAINQDQKKVIEDFFEQESAIDFITKEHLVRLFKLINDPLYDYTVLNGHVLTLLFPCDSQYLHSDIA